MKKHTALIRDKGEGLFMKKEILVISAMLALAQPTGVFANASDVQVAGEMASGRDTAALEQPVKSDMEEYTLRQGDELNIFVLQDERISNTTNSSVTPYKVRPDGTISLPYVGVINVQGMTVNEVTMLLKRELSRYIVNPEVSVNIMKLGGIRVYVFGEVKKPGAVQLTKSHTVVDAIGAAGSFTADAAKKKLVLIRRDDVHKMTYVNFNKMITQGDLSENYELHEGDILYMTRNHRITFARDIAPLITATYNVKRIEEM